MLHESSGGNYYCLFFENLPTCLTDAGLTLVCLVNSLKIFLCLATTMANPHKRDKVKKRHDLKRKLSMMNIVCGMSWAVSPGLARIIKVQPYSMMS